MEKLNEVIEFVAHRVMFSRVFTDGYNSPTIRSIDHYSNVDECIKTYQEGNRGYTIPDCYLPYFAVQHHRLGIDVTTTEIETTKVPYSKLKAACQAIWDREKSNQLTLF